MQNIGSTECLKEIKAVTVINGLTNSSLQPGWTHKATWSEISGCIPPWGKPT